MFCMTHGAVVPRAISDRLTTDVCFRRVLFRVGGNEMEAAGLPLFHIEMDALHFSNMLDISHAVRITAGDDDGVSRIHSTAK